MLYPLIIVVLGCGAKIAENCTYFQSAASSQPAGQCGVTICQCSSDICQVSSVHKLRNTILGDFQTPFEYLTRKYWKWGK